jgi:hypothetical protein
MAEAMTLSGLALFGLGAFHGVNPAMGWLFAVALGLQEAQARAVWRALLPLTLGHTLAVGAMLGAAAATGLVLPTGTLRPVLAAMLVGLGVLRIVRHRHRRWAGMRVGLPGLVLWSFMMATAHGAGLMVVPLVIDGPIPGATAAATQAHDHHDAASIAEPGQQSIGVVTASVVHTLGYFTMTALMAWLVYARLGLAVLRTSWINLDLVWAGALVLTGLLTLVG